jgi:predicted TIM-barrel fold metal-dependent hydrolase
MRKYPERFIGTIAIDYDIQKDQKYREVELVKLRDWIVNRGMKGVFQGFPRSQRDKMDDVLFDPYWQELCALRTPHIFITGFESKEGYLASLSALEKVVRKFPDLIAVIGHLGGNVRYPEDPNFTATPEELLPLLRLPNVYFEVGYVLAYENWDIWKQNYEYPYPLHTRLIRRIYDEIGAGRLLWGSDMPNIYRTCTYQQCLDIVRLHFDFMTEREKQMVLSDNAVSVFQVAA